MMMINKHLKNYYMKLNKRKRRKLEQEQRRMRYGEHQARSHLRVIAGLFEQGNHVLDATGLPVASNYSIYNPLDLKNRQVLLPDYIILFDQKLNLFHQIFKCQMQLQIYSIGFISTKNMLYFILNCIQKLKIKLQEITQNNLCKKQYTYSKHQNESNYNSQIIIYIKKFRRFLSSANIIFRANISINNQHFQFKQNKQSKQKFKKAQKNIISIILEYHSLHKLNDEYDGMKYRQQVKISYFKRSQSFQKFICYELVYTEKDIKQFKKQMKHQHKKPKLEEIKDISLDNSPYIDNRQQLLINEQFERRHVIDFYIDGLIFLPNKVTQCIIYMEVYNRRYEKLFDAENAAPDLNRMAYNPKFYFRGELRKEKLDPTAIALITVITVDKSTNDTLNINFVFII